MMEFGSFIDKRRFISRPTKAGYLHGPQVRGQQKSILETEHIMSPPTSATVNPSSLYHSRCLPLVSMGIKHMPTNAARIKPADR